MHPLCISGTYIERETLKWRIKKALDMNLLVPHYNAVTNCRMIDIIIINIDDNDDDQVTNQISEQLTTKSTPVQHSQTKTTTNQIKSGFGER